MSKWLWELKLRYPPPPFWPSEFESIPTFSTNPYLYIPWPRLISYLILTLTTGDPKIQEIWKTTNRQFRKNKWSFNLNNMWKIVWCLLNFIESFNRGPRLFITVIQEVKKMACFMFSGTPCAFSLPYHYYTF